MNIHYAVSLDTFGGELEDGSKAVCLVFKDKDTNAEDAYPIPIDIAEDLGMEIRRIAEKLKKGSE